MKRSILRNPKGSRDWLPDEVIKQEFIRKSLVNVFELWGYQPIQTPILNNLETVSYGSSRLSDIAFKLFGQQGELLALRADLTTPIARVTAERLKGKPLPFRFYYVGKVFRYHARKTTNERELYQIGIELIGAKEGVSDLECIQILQEGLKKTGLKNYLILVNHTILWNELFKCFGKTAEELFKSLSQKDLISFKSILNKSKLSKNEKLFWEELINIRGTKDAIKQLKALSKKVKKLKIKNTVSCFEKIINTFGKNVEIDLSLTSDLDYYTGIYFEAISPLLGTKIGSGGRYDGLIGKFGFNIPAIGFSLCLEDLLLILERQGKIFPKFKLPKFISQTNNTKTLFTNINKLHKKNKHATIKL